MEWLISAWATIEPYFLKLVEWLAQTGIGACIASLIVNKIYKNKLASNTSEATANAVADKIVGTDIKVSLESVNREQLEKIKKELLNTFGELTADLSLMKELLCIVGKVMAKFKAVTDEERNELLHYSNLLGKKQTTIEEIKSEPIVVKIEPVAETKETLF